MNVRDWTARIAVALVASALAACSGSSGDSGPPGDPTPGQQKLVSTPTELLALEERPSCSAFNEHLTNAVTGLFVNGGFVGCRDCLVTLAGGAAVQASLGTDQQSFDRFTETNNQEAGVDELDHIDTDANGYFYLIDGTQLVVANGLPPTDLRAVAKLDLGWRADGLVLDPANRRLVIVRSELGFLSLAQWISPPTYPEPVTELVFVDVADPAAPVIERRLKIEGFKLAVRRIGSRVHLITHMTPFMPLPLVDDAELESLREHLADLPADGQGALRIKAQIRARVAALVAGTDPFDFLPNVEVSTGSQAFTDITPANCGGVAIPKVASRLALTTVTSVDSDGTDASSLTVASNSWNVYASETNVYLSQTSGSWWFDPNQRQQTVVYKIGIGAERPAYRAVGAVDGWADSSFQFSEHNGFLRIATHRADLAPDLAQRVEDNHVWVLGDDGAGRLNVVGKVNGFAPGERIYSARFLGTRGFVVTFRRVDPLFTFDLSVPQDPRLVGQVEIPGVSTYVHPLDAAHLLTIGYDGDQNRLNGQFQLQIFDVQNLAEPRLLHKLVPRFDAAGFAWTAAVHDHLAFNYFPEGGTLTVPVQYFATSTTDHFSGFVAFSVSAANGFSELGRLDHSDLARTEHCKSPSGVAPQACGSPIYLQAAQPRRAVSAQLAGATYIYTLS
ncbi:MAG TPA: beta-propeller domain-containing protein, partial [Gammaproteobacteria bacterium]|nr:beta-propeller domain-containing protein [Gammaproteobacteria bacterium]